MDSAIEALAFAPSQAYRELMYRPEGQASRWLGQRLEVLARPGQRMATAPKVGDVMLQVALGLTGVGVCSVLTDVGLSRHRANGADGSAGWYAAVTDAAGAAVPLTHRVLDPAGRLLPGLLLLRPRASLDDGTADPHPFAEHEADVRTVPVDSAAAVPPFEPTERMRIVEPLLSASQSSTAIAWNIRVHPSTSGVTMKEIRGALASYVDTGAVQTAIIARNKRTPADRIDASTTATDAVLIECIHQFQKKCYSEEREHDGQAGESTLDSLGLIARAGPRLRGADRGHAKAQQRLNKLDTKLQKSSNGKEITAANWFDRMTDPAVFGIRTKRGTGLHVILVRKLRQAERHLLAQPAYSGKTPVQLGKALGLNEKHGGARPAQTQSTSVHTFGLAIDIEYRANPWVRTAASWAVLQRAAKLVSGTVLPSTSAPKYFSSLGSDPHRSTGQVWDEIQQRNKELIAYLALGDEASTALHAALQLGQARGTADLVGTGESLEDAVVRWHNQIRHDQQTLDGGDFQHHEQAGKGFLTIHRDLVIALRDYGCLAWGAVDLGPGPRGSGDMMHFDARIDGVGRVLVEGTDAFVPTVGHPCLGTVESTGGSSTDADYWTDAESDPDKAKDTIRAQTNRWGTDETAVMAALRALRPSDMAELSTDPTIVDALLGELSGDDLASAGTELARGRVGAMTRTDLARILASPVRHRFGTLAAAAARDVLLGHQEAFDRTGTGTIHGNQCPSPKPPGAIASDCTTYVLDVLKRTYTAKVQTDIWRDVLKDALSRSGPAGLKGTEAIKALQVKQGWEAVFWSPDPRNPADGNAEHPYAYKIVGQKGTYYGIAVDKTKSVINYRRTNPAAPGDLSGIERLRRLQFGVLAMRGGTHLALIVNGAVYEVHWETAATDRNAVESTPLESFGWQSGVIASPPGDLALAWRTP